MLSQRSLTILGLLVLTLGGGAGSGRSAEPPAEVVLRGGTIVDGTGAPPARLGDVLLRGGRIEAIGKVELGRNTRVVEVNGLVVAPGFIDLHTHSDSGIVAARTRHNRNYQAQGVTTIVTGNCGGGPIEVGRYLAEIEAAGAGSNVIHLIPHGSVRRAVMGNGETKPTEAALAEMKAIVDKGMREGAWGMSTGLIYLPGRYADTDELIELSRVVAGHGGIYASHIRDEGAGLLRSIDEALAIGRGAGLPVHVSHLKASGRKNWGLAVAACDKIAAARAEGVRVSADQYPYVASSTQLGAMVVPHWARQGTAQEFARIAADPEKGPRLRAEVAEGIEGRNGGAAVRIARYAKRPDWVGKDLAAIARAEGRSAVDIVLEIEANGGAAAISFGMSEDDVRHILRRDFVATASDGGAHAPGGADKPHPRAYGTFPRKFRYALDDKLISLEQAVRSCSGLPAEILGLPDRGVLRAGAVADVVVFDPATFRDQATFDDPTRYAEGVRHLFVNGVAVVADGKPLDALPGRPLRLDRDGPASLILKVGRIWTGDPEKPRAEAVAVRAGAIVAVGTAAEVLTLKGPMTRVIDRPGDFAMPGLVDAHGHIEMMGAEIDKVDLRGVASLEEVQRRIRDRIAQTPGDGWILGMNWDQSLWPGGAFPTAAVLDAAAPDRPVWLTRVDGHAGWANTEALRRAKVTAESKAPDDGQILRDPDGRPTGVFVDGAMGLVDRVVPPARKADLTRRILAAQDRILAAGLTGVHDAGLSRPEIEVFRELDRSGQLRMRVYGMASPGSDPAKFVSAPPPPTRPGARFELRAIKLFMDGAMGSRGALLFEPYSDDPGNTGLMLIEPEVLTATATAALRNGWQVCTHAIGDRGNALVLDAYEAARQAVPAAADPRFRVEHAQAVRKQDVARFRSSGTIASMQPSHASDDMRWADARLGPGRVDGAYAWRWFLDAGVPLAFGSDFPVEVVTPFYGIYAALTRQDAQGWPEGGWHPDQRLTLDETLRAFTAGSAHAAFAEDRLGTLRVGMRADLTVVDRDLFAVSPRELLDAKVTLTIVEGEVVHERTGP